MILILIIIKNGKNIKKKKGFDNKVKRNKKVPKKSKQNIHAEEA